MIPLALLAAAAAPAGWKARPDQGRAQVFDSQVSLMTSMLVFPSYPAAGFGPEMLRQTIGKMPFCPPAGQVEQPAGEGSLRLIAGAADRRCIAQAQRSPSGDWRVALGIALGRNAMAEPALVSAVAEFAGAGEVRPASAPRAAAAVPSTTSGLPRPIGAVIQGKSGFIGYPPMVTFTNTPWFLFPGGVATDCTRIAGPPTLAALRTRKDCTGGRWRRAGGKIELQIEDGDPWVSDMVHALPPVPRGTRLDFRGQRRAAQASTTPVSAAARHRPAMEASR